MPSVDWFDLLCRDQSSISLTEYDPRFHRSDCSDLHLFCCWNTVLITSIHSAKGRCSRREHAHSLKDLLIRGVLCRWIEWSFLVFIGRDVSVDQDGWYQSSLHQGYCSHLLCYQKSSEHNPHKVISVFSSILVLILVISSELSISMVHTRPSKFLRKTRSAITWRGRHDEEIPTRSRIF